MKWIPKYQKEGKLNFKTIGLPWQQSKQDQEIARNAQSKGTLNPTNLKRRLQPAAKNLKTKYNNLSVKERIALAKKSMPHSEIVTVRDQQGNTKTSTNPQAGADPIGEFIVGTAAGNLGLGLGKMALSKMGQNTVSHWARNSLLNETAGNLTKNVSKGITNNLAAKEYTTRDNPIMQLSYYKPTRKAWSTGKAEGSLNGDQLRKYVMEARERYGLIDNSNISDEEIAQALYKHTNELGKGSAAINSQGEPQLLFRGDTKPYTKLKVNHNQIGKSDTEDNVLGTMFLDRTGIGEGWGPDRYLANQENRVMAPYRSGIETESFTTLQPKFKPGYVNLSGEKGVVGDFDISYPYYKHDGRYGVISGGKISSEAFANGYTNQLNGFVVRTPHERDITNEVYTNGMGRIPKVGEEFQWRVPHTTDISSAPRETRILQNKAIIKDAQQKNQGLLRSKAGSPYRDEYDYLVVPDFNVKHILPYDLRVPRNWSDPNIFRIAAPIGMSLPFLNNSQK